MNSWYHALSASREWGGEVEDYLPIESFIDSSKMTIGDDRHRALYHHTLGVWLCEQKFGPSIEVKRRRSSGTIKVPVRLIAERHIIEDLGRIPHPAEYLSHIPLNTPGTRWMGGPVDKSITLSALGLHAPAGTDTAEEEHTE